MLRFFDYVFYKVCVVYDKNGGSSPGVSGLLIVSLMQFFNLFSVFCLFSLMINKKIYINEWLAIPVILLFMVLNGLHFNKYNYDYLKNKWKDEDPETFKKRESIVIWYVILSFVACFGLAIYGGSRK